MWKILMFEISAKNGFCDVIWGIWGSKGKTSDLAAHFSRNSGVANTVLFTIQTFNEHSRMAELTRALERVWESRALERGGRFCPSLLSQLLWELESPNLVSEKTCQWTLWCAILVTLGQYFKGQMGSNLKNMDIFGEMTSPLTPV